MGQNLPHEDLAKVFDYYEPDYVLSTVTSALDGQAVQAFVNNLSASWPNTTIILTGYLIVSNTNLKLPRNVKVIKEISELNKIANEAQKIYSYPS